MLNIFSFQYLEAIVKNTTENLKCLIHAPSVQLQDVPEDFFRVQLDEEDELNEMLAKEKESR